VREIDVNIADIYVPVDKRKLLDQGRVDSIAESIMDSGQEMPILLRQGKGRLVLVEGLHRLEACKALGETTISALMVQARRS